MEIPNVFPTTSNALRLQVGGKKKIAEVVKDDKNSYHTATFNWYKVNKDTNEVFRMDLSKENEWDKVY